MRPWRSVKIGKGSKLCLRYQCLCTVGEETFQREDYQCRPDQAEAAELGRAERFLVNDRGEDVQIIWVKETILPILEGIPLLLGLLLHVRNILTTLSHVLLCQGLA